MEHLYTLKGKAALITGSCRGIGRMIAEGLLGAGARVIISGRDETFTNTVARELAELGNCRAICGDLSSREGLDKLARNATAMEPGLNILINNAAIHLPDSLSENDPDQFTQVYRNNATSTFELSRLLLPVLVKNSKEMDPSRIVNISSGMGQLSDMGGQFPGYRISKTALNAVTRIFAAELDPAKFRVNAICPGWVRTDMGGENAELSVEEGVDTAIWLATSAEANGTGGYYRKRKLIDW